MAVRNTPLPGSGVEAGISTYLHRKGAALGVPLSGTFELTRRCNFNCRMCYIHSGENTVWKGGELSAGTWLAIASQAVKAGMLFLLLTGGEPLLREDFEEIYCGLNRMGLALSVNTNGSLLKVRTMARFLLPTKALSTNNVKVEGSVIISKLVLLNA